MFKANDTDTKTTDGPIIQMGIMSDGHFDTLKQN